MNIYQKLLNIQVELKAPKNQYSEFGKYHYRSCEDILEALKPLLLETKTILTITDEMVQVGDRYYVKSIATLIDTEELGEIKATAYAREDENKAKMDLSQMTGSASSYARKYALNGLFAIDDTKDSDTANTGGKNEGQAPTTQNKPSTTKKDKKVDEDKKAINDNSLASDAQLELIYKLTKEKNCTAESMSSYIKNTYNKNNSKELTKKEASEIIEMLNGLGK